MLLANIVLLLAANLASGAAVAVGTSSDVINLDATDLQRRAACAAAGVVNGQCGRYYRGTGCSDQIGAIGPGVSLNSLNASSLAPVPPFKLPLHYSTYERSSQRHKTDLNDDSSHRDAAGNATPPPMPSPASGLSATVPMGLTVTCTMTAIVRTRLARLETLLLVAGSVTRLRAGRLGIASCAGTGARLLVAI
ncbi:hypothetical protein CSIM01_11299 [Colletotrichum simmondsii]|uniref:Uncharacterized protein n=1 Tax=Colletotrichum simmondsii TaxID=703756 RepID=A0A135TX01_9PEZI|nr:hypothetical protein CSIM01_11299 [Colletotrichum simmondsii]